MILILGLLLYAFIMYLVIKDRAVNYNKLAWVLTLILLPILGVLLYVFIGSKQKIKGVF